jgi:hypothetical protein
MKTPLLRFQARRSARELVLTDGGHPLRAPRSSGNVIARCSEWIPEITADAVGQSGLAGAAWWRRVGNVA